MTMLQDEYDGSEPHLHDDCPVCRAMAEVGIEPNSAVTMEQYQRVEARMREIIAEEGPPPGMIMISQPGFGAEEADDPRVVQMEDLLRQPN